MPFRTRAHTTQPSTPALAPCADERLNVLQERPDLAGHQVHKAEVYPLGQTGAPLLFTYARHVQSIGADLVASHLTYLPTGELIIEERVTTSSRHGFQRFDVANRQTGLSGSVVLHPEHRQLRFERTGTTPRYGTEVATDPVVAGPNLHGHILQHWDTLVAGTPQRVRLVVLARMETLGFTVRLSEAGSDFSAFTVTPSHLLIRLAVSPLRVVFDNATRRVLRYEGRVPPMRAVGKRLVDLDARVDYHWIRDSYL